MNLVEKVRIFICTNAGNLARRLGSWEVRACFLGALVLLALLSAGAQQESMQKAAPKGAVGLGRAIRFCIATTRA